MKKNQLDPISVSQTLKLPSTHMPRLSTNFTKRQKSQIDKSISMKNLNPVHFTRSPSVLSFAAKINQNKINFYKDIGKTSNIGVRFQLDYSKKLKALQNTNALITNSFLEEFELENINIFNSKDNNKSSKQFFNKQENNEFIDKILKNRNSTFNIKLPKEPVSEIALNVKKEIILHVNSEQYFVFLVKSINFDDENCVFINGKLAFQISTLKSNRKPIQNINAKSNPSFF